MRELRLLVFSPYFPPHVGGLEGYVSDLDQVLLDGGQVEAITVFAPRLPPDSAPVERRSDRHLVVRYPAFELIPNFPVPKLWSRAFWSALRSAAPKRHDLFVSHTRFFLSSTLALACARVLRRPLLHVEHGSDFVQLGARAPRIAARIYDLVLGRWLLRHADGVVAISHAAADFVQRLAKRDAQVVHRGMWTERLDATEADRDVLDWAAGRVVVTFAGRLIDGKGVADLVAAFARLGDERAVLCIVGDGPRREDLEALVRRLGIADRVRMAGYLSEDRAWSVIRSSDIVVNPSYTEGLPTSVLEGALMGKAVLASDVGGTREIVTDGEGALLFEPRDLEALHSHLARLVADSGLRERLGATARAGTAKRFDWSVSASQFARIARELV
ncbi:MAG TPA: glycosyltransferase family 4 protein [Solirubrobacteraceae bacterium]|nr:glycosyltransferase family 4 protein [Solirubrobacteraceae bacterium]